MRNRRAIVFDDEPIILNLLENVLKRRDYEVFLFEKPIACPVFRNNDRHCHSEKPCADVMIADFNMPEMTGVELFELQRVKGCRLDIRNKAIISGMANGDDIREFITAGGTFFSKPFRLSNLTEWIQECEQRMPLTKPVGIPRKERRQPVSINISYSPLAMKREMRGIVTDISDSGFCLQVAHDIPERELIIVDADLPVSCRRASVRWTRRLTSSSVLAGLSCY